jgi:hypothetical protein
MNRFEKKSNCLWARERIESFLDKELGTAELTTFQSHVDVCAECRRELARATRVLQKLHGLPELHCPDKVIDGVMAGLEKRPRAARHNRIADWFGVLRPALAAAFAVLVVVSALWVVDRVRSPQITPAEVADAEAELKWTLAYLEDISRRSAMTAATQAFDTGMLRPVRRAVDAAFETESPANQQLPRNEQSPRNQQSPKTPPGGGSV